MRDYLCSCLLKMLYLYPISYWRFQIINIYVDSWQKNKIICFWFYPIRLVRWSLGDWFIRKSRRIKKKCCTRSRNQISRKPEHIFAHRCASFASKLRAGCYSFMPSRVWNGRCLPTNCWPDHINSQRRRESLQTHRGRLFRVAARCLRGGRRLLTAQSAASTTRTTTTSSSLRVRAAVTTPLSDWRQRYPTRRTVCGPSVWYSARKKR